MLFRPFRPETWLVLGFAAFLSEFLSSHEGGRYAWRGNRGAQLAHHMGWFTGFSFSHLALAIGSVVAVIVLAVFVVLLWVNCRGKFIFLDDVVRGRAAIVEPWKRFHRLGHSLFAWTLVFELVGIAIGVLMALP